MTLSFDVCRCVAQKCKVSPKCARWVNPQKPEPDPGRPIPHADFSTSGLPCQHFLAKEK